MFIARELDIYPEDLDRDVFRKQPYNVGRTTWSNMDTTPLQDARIQQYMNALGEKDEFSFQGRPAEYRKVFEKDSIRKRQFNDDVFHRVLRCPIFPGPMRNLCVSSG